MGAGVLKQRVLTATILLAIVIGAMVWSRTAFAAVATVIMALALDEWLQLTGATRLVSRCVALVVAVLLLAVAAAQYDLIEVAAVPLSAVAAAVWLVIAAILVQPGAIAFKLPRAIGMALALLLVFAAWFALMHLLLQGAIMLLSVVFIVSIADTAAYFAGRAFGRRKLAPHISPGKTWAGVAGGVTAVVLVALVGWQLAPGAALFSNGLFAAIGVFAALLLLAMLVAMSVIGDLFESLLKRQAGVKDSSQLLPGHGGALDRIDAMVPVLPAAVVMQWLIR